MTRATMAAPLLVGLLFTAGCSGSDVVGSNAAATGSTPEPTKSQSALAGMSAQEVWTKTEADSREAKSVHVIGRMQVSDDKIALNLKIADSGNAFGAIVVNGDKMSVRRLGQTIYFKANHRFWATNAGVATADVLANKWIMMKKGAPGEITEFFQLTDLETLLDETMAITAASAKTLTLGPGIDIAQQSTVALVDKSAEPEKGEFQTLYISDTDPALPMNLSMPTDDTQYMRFRGWNEDFTVVAPKGAIDLATSSN